MEMWVYILLAMASWMPTYGPNYSHTTIHNETVRNNPNWFCSNPACLQVESWNRRLLRVPLLSKISKILNEEGISRMWAFYGMIMISVKFCRIQALYIMCRVFVFPLYASRKVINNVFLNSTTLIITVIIFPSLSSAAEHNTRILEQRERERETGNFFPLRISTTTHLTGWKLLL